MTSASSIHFVYTGHSADVRMELQLKGGMSLPIGQLGPDFPLLDTPLEYPPTDAMLLLSVDGNERRWPVHLPQDISAESSRVVIAKL